MNKDKKETKPTKESPSPIDSPNNATTMRLFEAAANVANTLDTAVDTVIQSHNHPKEPIEPSKIMEVINENINNESPTKFPFDVAEHLADFADKISETVLKEIAEYEQIAKLERETRETRETKEKEEIKPILENDPYIQKLSEEIKDLTKLSAELNKERAMYLTKMTSSESIAQLIPDSVSTGSSDWSRTDSLGEGSTASLNSEWTRSKLMGRRSTSEDIPEVKKRAPLLRQHASFQEPFDPVSVNTTSQESLASESAGGSISIHRYYHVFREGELDQLIERYVENLHIITSYYDHASWCIVAEKVRVWTI